LLQLAVSPPPEGSGFDFIRNATLAQLQSKSFRATTKNLHPDGSSTVLVLEYVAPDRMHLSNGTSEQSPSKVKAFGSKTRAYGQVRATPRRQTEFLVRSIPNSLDELLKQIEISSVKFVGAELLDGKPMFVYQIHDLH